MPYAPEYYTNGGSGNSNNNGGYPDWQQIYEQQSWPPPPPPPPRQHQQYQQLHQPQTQQHQYFQQSPQNIYATAQYQSQAQSYAPSRGHNPAHQAHLPQAQNAVANTWNSPPLPGQPLVFSTQPHQSHWQHQQLHHDGFANMPHSQPLTDYQTQVNFANTYQNHQQQQQQQQHHHLPLEYQSYQPMPSQSLSQVLQDQANHPQSQTPNYTQPLPHREDQQTLRTHSPAMVAQQSLRSPDTIAVTPRQRVHSVQMPMPSTETGHHSLKSSQMSIQQAHKASSPDTVTVTPKQLHHNIDASTQRKHSYTQADRTPKPVAYVQVPRQAPSETSSKRRKSNDGTAIPMSHLPIKAYAQPQQSGRSPKSSQMSKPEVKQEVSVVDYKMLLQLSDEYVAAAFALAKSCTQNGMDDATSERYCDLMATGMGCLESVLRNFRLPDPRKESRIRLRLATLMFEETENDMEVEELLSKGISLCERSRLTDLKFAMQHLLARVMFKSKPKAALKTIEKAQHEVEALSLVNWTYAFRFLSISLLIQRSSSTESPLLLRNLTALSTQAEQYRHTGVHVIAALLEAIVHLRSKSEEAIDSAQRALATARTHQLDPTMQTMPQVPVLLSILDLACSLRVCRPKEIAPKLDAMQKQLDPISKNRVWNADGYVSVPLSSVDNNDIGHDTAGIFTIVGDGTCVLSIRWMAQANIYALGFLLSGIVSLTKTTDHENAIRILQQALKCTQMKSDTALIPFSSIVLRDEELKHLEFLIRLHLVFAYTATSRWTLATSTIQEIHNILGRSKIEADPANNSLLLYLQGVCKQATGDLQGAIQTFTSPLLCSQTDVKGCTFERDIQTLATLNKILILRSTQNQQQEAETLLNSIQSYCTTHDNKALGSAFHIIKATTPNSGMPIVKVKQQIQAALNSAQAVSNNQLLCIIMNTMTLLFFKDIVGQQALKCGNAGRTFANKVHDPLWKVVADAMYGDTLERCGELGKAIEMKTDGEAAWMQVPQGVKDNLQRQGIGQGL